MKTFGGGGGGRGSQTVFIQVPAEKNRSLCSRLFPLLLLSLAIAAGAYALSIWMHAGGGEGHPFRRGQRVHHGHDGRRREEPAPAGRDAAADGLSGPLRLESVMALWRVLAASSLEVAGAVVGRPLGFLLERLEAAALAPTVHRLLNVPMVGPESGAPPWWAKTAMGRACELVLEDTGLPCPTLHVVGKEPTRRIETLPVGVLRRRHRIFISRGLLDVGILHGELTALLVRELLHLRAFHWRPPAGWAILGAWRSSALPRPRLEGLPAEVKRELRQGWAQLLELCRMQAATTAAARAAKASAVDLGVINPVADWWLQHATEYATLVEVCDFLEAPRTNFAKAEQLRRLVMGYGPAARGIHAARKGAAGAASYLVSRLSKAKAREKDRGGKPQPRPRARDQGTTKPSDLRRSPGLRVSSELLRPVMLGLLAAGRASELSVDRAAAGVLGGIETLAAGLVRLYGTEEERRRVDRGDVRGLIDGSCVVLGTRGGLLRWEMWFESLVTGPVQPPLLLRLADLAAWEEFGNYGRFMPWRRTDPK